METDPLNILLVEDDDVDILTIQRTFKKNNIRNALYIAKNGQEALDMLRGTNGVQQIMPLPKIILSDINMPKMNGLEMIHEIRKDKDLHHLSIFVLTTSNDDKDRIEAFNLNVAGYIIKPLSMESFINAIAVLKNYWQLVFPIAITNEQKPT